MVTLAHLNKVCNQCYQIWRNFATLAKCSNSLAILEGIFSTRQNIEDTLVIFYTIGQMVTDVKDQTFGNLVTLSVPYALHSYSA